LIRYRKSNKYENQEMEIFLLALAMFYPYIKNSANAISQKIED
jgi:hypothetical protein